MLAAAVKDAVAEWRQHLDFDSAAQAIEDPVAFTAQILPLVEQQLALSSVTVGELRAIAQQEVFIHLPNAFETQGLDETPSKFLPVPSSEGVLRAKAAAIAAMAVIGLQAVSYGSENEGALFVNLVGIPGDGTTATKSKKEMRGHTDGASFPPRGQADAVRPKIAPSPDVVCLVGLRNPDLIVTTVMPLPAIIKQLSEAYVNELKKPQFEIITQETFIKGTQRTIGETHIAENVAVLYYIDGNLATRFSHTRVTADNSEAATEALTAFKGACAECKEEVVIRPGDVLLVSNRYALHGRQVVGGEVGGETRWLLRTYGLVAGAARPDQFHSGSNFKLFP
mgnify:CR=1 FL=1